MPSAEAPQENKIEEYTKQEYDSLRIEFQEYDQLVELVCCIELWLEHNYGPGGTYGARLVYFDRYPPCVSEQGQYGPDFTALFEDGYGLVGEVKRWVHPPGEGLEALLRQLHTYASVDFPLRAQDEPEPSIVPARKDTLLLMPLLNAVEAIGLVGDARNANGELDLAASPVMIGHGPDDRRGPEEYYWWNFKWYDIEGNSRFLAPNVMSPEMGDHEGDLNHQFCSADALPMHVEREKHSERKVAISFCSDEPPAIYALVNKVWRYIHTDFVASLSEQEKNRWVRKSRIEAHLSVSEMTDSLSRKMAAGAVRGQWIRTALDLLVEIGWAKKIDGDQYLLDFKKPASMKQEQKYFMQRLAAKRAKKRVREEEQERQAEASPR